MPKIAQLFAREILDSRSDPTLEVVMTLDDGSYGVSSVPSGAVTSSIEAVELRDNDPNRYFGRGVLNAVSHVNQEIAKAVINQSVESPAIVDNLLIKLDGTPNKSRLGANAIFGVSMSAVKALAFSAKLPLYKYIAQIANNTHPLTIPIPVFNMVNGGKHGAGNLDFQEFHVLPTRADSFSSRLQIGVEIYQTIKRLLARRGAIHSIGDEGGFAPNLFTNLDALEILTEAITECHKQPTIDVELGLDVAANVFFKDNHYTIKDRSSPMETPDFIEYLRDLNKQYNLRLLEDALNLEDWKGWSQLTSDLGGQVTVVGDDLLLTNSDRLAKAIAEKACNGAVIKPNEAGTVTETLAVLTQARSAGFKIILTHRSGETTDTFIADFAVGVGADYAKFGAPARGERVAKYNRFLAIESELSQAR
jgi:enolase